MALWDSADLLARCKRLRRRPTTDEGTTPEDWYAMLTEAEAHWKPVLAAHYPHDMWSAPALMTSADGGYTYTFPSSVVDPLALVVMASATGRLLRPGPHWDAGADFSLDVGGIRMTAGRARTFADGPYCRLISAPAEITASVGSTIKPERARALLVYAACRLDASRGGMDDPAFYHALEQKAAFGDPAIPGDVGIIGSLKARLANHGQAAYPSGDGVAWWRPNG